MERICENVHNFQLERVIYIQVLSNKKQSYKLIKNSLLWLQNPKHTYEPLKQGF